MSASAGTTRLSAAAGTTTGLLRDVRRTYFEARAVNQTDVAEERWESKLDPAALAAYEAAARQITDEFGCSQVRASAGQPGDREDDVAILVELGGGGVFAQRLIADFAKLATRKAA